MKMLKSANTVFALIFLGLISCSTPSSTGQTGAVKLEAKSFDAQIKATSNPQIIDVRTPEEYNSGHLPDAQNINIYAGNFGQTIDLLSKEDTVFVYCKAGGRSANAASQLIAKGFKHVYDLDGGIMKWDKANLAIEGVKSGVTAAGMSVDLYDSITSSQPLVVVDFYAPWCGPCKKMAPFLKKLDDTYSDSTLKIVKVDVDQNQTISNHFGIDGIPNIKIYHDGKLIKDHLGYMSEAELMSVVQPYLKG